MSIREAFPLLARNEGVWEGYYRYYNIDGDKIDEHKSRLLCRIPDPDTYHQTNLYRWADGKKDTRDFPSKVEGNKLLFYTDIEGWAAAVDLDEHGRTMMLHWVRKNEPGLYLYEMIQINDEADKRARVWQWFRDGRLLQRTIIDEIRISEDWRAYNDIDPTYDEMLPNGL